MSNLFPPDPQKGELYEFMGRHLLVLEDGIWTWTFDHTGAPVWMWWPREYAGFVAGIIGERYK